MLKSVHACVHALIDTVSTRLQMGQPQLPGRGPEILANLLRHPGGCCGVVTWSCAARTRHVSDLFLAGGAGWLLSIIDYSRFLVQLLPASTCKS